MKRSFHTRAGLVSILGLMLSVPVLADEPLPAEKPWFEMPRLSPTGAKFTNEDMLPGTDIQRTMSLLASTGKERPEEVRILFYGGTRMADPWWQEVAQDLRQRFPTAKLNVRNASVKDFTLRELVETAEHDIYPFYPDLVVLHAPGHVSDLEQLIINIRSRTTAEVLLLHDASFDWYSPTQPTVDVLTRIQDLRPRRYALKIAQDYDCGYLDVGRQWTNYLKEKQLQPVNLMPDGQHLNEHGLRLMADLVKSYLVPRPEQNQDGWKDLVKTYIVGKDIHWEGSKLRLEFEGNRIETIEADTEVDLPIPGTATVLIDGKRPSEWRETVAVTRPVQVAGPRGAVLLSIYSENRPVTQDWFLNVTKLHPGGRGFEFEVRGGVTGFDGQGRSWDKFVSNSGQVIIPSFAWYYSPNQQVPQPQGVTAFNQPNIQYKWTSSNLGRDGTGGHYKLSGMPLQLFRTRRGPRLPLIQGLPNGKHVLELHMQLGRAVLIGGFRVFKPPLAH